MRGKIAGAVVPLGTCRVVGTLDVTITLTTEGGTQVFNVTVPEAPDELPRITVIATIIIPGGACPASSGLFGDACDSLSEGAPVMPNWWCWTNRR